MSTPATKSDATPLTHAAIGPDDPSDGLMAASEADAALLLERGARAEQAAPLLARIAETLGAPSLGTTPKGTA